MTAEKEKQVRQELLKLMTENPDLPILCVGLKECCTYWRLGNIEKVSVKKVFLVNETFYLEEDKDYIFMIRTKEVVKKCFKEKGVEKYFNEKYWESFGDNLMDYWEKLTSEQKEKICSDISWETVILAEIRF